jgi:isopenicillin N synthase-like dioxygenase
MEPHEGDIQHFTNLCNKTAARVMRLLALGLEVPPAFPPTYKTNMH